MSFHVLAGLGRHRRSPLEPLRSFALAGVRFHPWPQRSTPRCPHRRPAPTHCRSSGSQSLAHQPNTPWSCGRSPWESFKWPRRTLAHRKVNTPSLKQGAALVPPHGCRNTVQSCSPSRCTAMHGGSQIRRPLHCHLGATSATAPRHGSPMTSLLELTLLASPAGS